MMIEFFFKITISNDDGYFDKFMKNQIKQVLIVQYFNCMFISLENNE